MSYEPWPSPEARRGPLPRIEDLPIAEQGYEQEAVRHAFDSFYRHAAQLDASLKALEAVEAFRRDALELRADLRSLRELDVGGEAPFSTSFELERAPRELPVAVPRLAAEAALLIAVAVIAGVASFRAWVTIALMAAALAIVVLSEWLAARARFRVPANVYAPLYPLEAAPADEAVVALEATAPPEGEIASEIEAEVGWAAFQAAQPEPEAEPEALTMLGPVAEDTEEEPPPQPEQVGEAEPEAVEEEEPAPVAGAEAVTEAEAEVASDAEPVAEAKSDPGAEPEPEPGAGAEPEPVAAVAPGPMETEPARRGWFRRRRVEDPSVEQPPVGADVPEPAAQPSHVRIVPSNGVPLDPWEQGFDDAGSEPVPESESALGEPTLGRLRRRRR